MAHTNRVMPRALAQYQPQEGDLLVPAAPLQLKGMNSQLPLHAMDPGVARLVRDLCIRDGAYETRDGLSLVGTAAASDLIYSLDVGLSTGVFRLTRFRTNAVDVFNGATWDTATGAFTGLTTAPFAFSGWGDTLMFRAGSGKIWSLSYGPDVVTELADAPTGAIHLSTFNARAIATLPDGIYWSVRADNTDWSGLGSGFEDLKAAPGGRPDQPIAVVPITDEVAYHVRTNSIWQMNVTGDFDAPFSFSRLFEFVGGRYPQLCTAVTRGLICVDDHHIWLVSPEGFKDIGQPIYDLLQAAQPYMNEASATYDPVWQEYRIVLPGASDANQKVMRYNVKHDAWSYDFYDIPIKSIAYTLFTTTAPATSRPGMVYTVKTANFVVKDDFTKNNDPLRDVQGSGNRRTGGFRIETGDIRRTENITQKELVKAKMVYECETSVEFIFEYSYDGGITWQPYSRITVAATSRPTPLSVEKTIQRDFIQLAVYADITPTVRLHRLDAMIREGGDIVDAH
jgi:hypothetical protein